jgi:hypothetical protein
MLPRQAPEVERRMGLEVEDDRPIPLQQVDIVGIASGEPLT